jgi:uncharacterized membrane protein YfcA
VLTVGLVLSLAIGVSLGLLGGGGSTLTVPVLHYAFGIEAHQAIAMSLIVVAATSLVAMIAHARAGRVRWKMGLGFGGSSMAAAYVGGRLGAHLPGAMLIKLFALVMIAAGTAMLLRARRGATQMQPGSIHPARIVAVGLGVGLLTGILGAGGGFLIVPALTLAGGLPIAEAIGTSLMVIAMNSLAGLAGAATHASFDLKIAGLVTAIAISGSFLGARIGKRISAQALQRTFGWFVITVALFILVHELI